MSALGEGWNRALERAPAGKKGLSDRALFQ